jgi:2-keto-4-pentenoate hydratase/2-oxohepta-3-ene-1,7-dioic acid hydratase in catechol pathway
VKLALFNDFIPGLVHGDRVIDLRGVIGAIAEAPPAERLPRLIAEFDRLRPRLEEAGRGSGLPLAEVRLRPPLPRPSKIFCCIGNYKEGVEAPMQPLDMFLKSSDAVIGPDDTVELPPVPATIFHHEAELAVVIGRRAKRVAPDQAMAHVFGYTCFIDVSARGIGQRSFIGKSFDTFAPLGPWIVTADEVGDPQRLRVRLWVDGQLRHDYHTSDMEHPVAEVVAWASQVAALFPGDVLACGTNHQGIGPVQDGELVEVEIERIGRMRVRVQDPLQRRWPKGVDEEMARRVREARLARNP